MVDKIHCLVIADAETGGIEAYHHGSFQPCSGSLQDGYRRLKSASHLAGHNILGYDLPCLEKVAGVRLGAVVEDTQVWGHLAFSDLTEADMREAKIPKHLYGRQSLEAWGHRVGEHKGGFGKDFSRLTQEMLDYCIQDVKTNLKLYWYLRDRLPEFTSKDGIHTVELEAWFADFCRRLGVVGVPYDTEAADTLCGRLLVRRAQIDQELMEAFPAVKVSYKLTPTGKPRYVRDKETGELRDHKVIPFNPGSRQELAQRLIGKYDWAPKNWTTSGDVEMVEGVLMDLAQMYPEAKLAAEGFIVRARLGILQEGRGSYRKHLGPDGAIHGRILHIGAVTHRCAHRSPNLGNPTSVRKPYGLEMRGLFRALPGKEMVGVDASGLELRMLAHYLAKWDEGYYANVVVTGDVHTLHKDAVAAETGKDINRDQAKTIGYAYLYGAGDHRLGSVLGGGVQLGKKVRRAMRSRITGMENLLSTLEHRVKRTGSVLALDKRRVGIRKSHAALNSLLQSAGAVVMRWFLRGLQIECEKRGVRWWVDYVPHLFVHDEVQGSLDPNKKEQFQEAVSAAFDWCVTQLGLRVPLGGDVKYGRNWAETH